MIRRPWVIILVGVALLGPAIYLATGLELRTDFKELLPSNRPSVTELDRVGRSIGGLASMAVAIEGKDRAAMKRYADDLSARLRALPPGLIDHLDDTVKAERAFFERYGWLYASVEDLERARDALEKRVIQETPFNLGLEEDEPAQKSGSHPQAGAQQPESELKRLERELREKISPHDRFPEGYYIGEDGHLLAIWIYAAPATNMDATQRVVDRVRAEVAALPPENYHPSLRVTLTGDILTANTEYKALKGDIFLASGLCIGLVLLSIILFYGSLRSLVILGAALVMGVGLTFGFARLAIGYLNSSTAFLASIVAGNGINFGIILVARYFEERRRSLGVADAVDIAIRKTAAATGGAALAAGIAYGSLMATDFRGFNQFGIIGGFGMVICWIATYTIAPALIVLSERIPFVQRRGIRKWGDPFAKPFRFLVACAPRLVVVLGAALMIVSVVLSVRYIIRDPIEYDFGKLGNKARTLDYATEMGGRVWHIRGVGAEGLVLLGQRKEQVPLIREALEHRRQETGPDSPIGKIHTIEDLVPDRQVQKLAILRQIGRVVEKVRKKLDDEERKVAEKYRPPPDLHPISISDLPRKIVEPFTERDGTIGRVVFIETAPWLNHWNGHDLVRLAHAVERLQLKNGEIVFTSGQAVIFADIIRSVLADGPRSVLFSLAGVVLLIIIVMGRWRWVPVTLATLLTGVAMMLGAAAAFGWKLNFLNFVAIPITIGVGADYALNIVRRFLEDPTVPAEQVVYTTGGAVVLCSMTTIIGYGALLGAASRALNSFGMLAMIGELTCVFTAVAFLPAVLKLLQPRRGEAATEVAGASAQQGGQVALDAPGTASSPGSNKEALPAERDVDGHDEAEQAGSP